MRSIHIIALSVIAATASCSTLSWKTPTLPAHTTACNADYQCPSNYICGFDGVDQVPHCIYKPGVSKDSE